MKVFVLNTLGIGIDGLGILATDLNITGVIGLSDRAATDAISGFQYMHSYCQERDIQFVEVLDYSLRNELDRSKLLSLEIDYLIVSGWQRLVPKWLIQHVKIAVIGSHGSPYGITEGRGRSPQNWALILNKKEFYISIFKIDQGIDSGAIIDTCKFVISDYDTINTSYQKVTWLTAHMIIQAINSGKIMTGSLSEQKGKAYYLPQRTPSDGQIDWNRSATEIYNFIRALTKPYPGAYSVRDGGSIIKFWKAMPFQVTLFGKVFSPGEIVKIYHNGDLLIATGEDFLIVQDHEKLVESPALIEGELIPSVDFQDNIQEIVKRHQKKLPDFPVSPDLMKLIGGKNIG